MTQPTPITPSATPTTPGAAPANPNPTPAAPPVTPGTQTPPAPTPVTPSETPGTSTAPTRSILEQAGETPSAQSAWLDAAEAYRDDPSDENKAALDKALTDARAEAAKPPVSNVPEGQYEVKLGEGQEVDAALLNEITPALKEAGVSNDLLNKIFPLTFKIQEKAISEFQAHQVKEKADKRIADQKAAKAALGAKWPEQMGLVAKARDRFFSPESKAILAEHGDNLALINDLVRLGTAISEGKFVDGPPAGTPKSPAEVLFPSMKQT